MFTSLRLGGLGSRALGCLYKFFVALGRSFQTPKDAIPRPVHLKKTLNRSSGHEMLRGAAQMVWERKRLTNLCCSDLKTS